MINIDLYMDTQTCRKGLIPLEISVNMSVQCSIIEETIILDERAHL